LIAYFVLKYATFILFRSLCIDVIIEYFIIDFEGNEIKLGEETAGVRGTLTINRSFFIPKWLELGDYLFYTKLIYLDSIATSANRFTLDKEEPIVEKLSVIVEKPLIGTSLLVLIVISVLAILFVDVELRRHKIISMELSYSLRKTMRDMYLLYLRTKYSIKLQITRHHILKTQLQAGLFIEQLQDIKHLPTHNLTTIQRLLNKIKVAYLRTKYQIKLQIVKYHAGLYREQIKGLKHTPIHTLIIILNLQKIIKVAYLRINYAFKLRITKYHAGMYDQQIKEIKHIPVHELTTIQRLLIKIKIIYLRTKYSIKLQIIKYRIRKTQHRARLHIEHLQEIKHLPTHNLTTIQRLLNKIKVAYLRTKYAIKLRITKYHAGMYDQQIKEIKHIPVHELTKKLLLKIKVIYLRTIYAIKLQKIKHDIRLDKQLGKKKLRKKK